MADGPLQSKRALPRAPTPPPFYRLDNNMRTEELKNEIRKLEVSEKLILIEEIWEDIAKSNEDLPLPEWQKKELDKRLAAYDRGEVKTKDYHEVHEALRTKYK